jgi:hypothetical protein
MVPIVVPTVEPWLVVLTPSLTESVKLYVPAQPALFTSTLIEQAAPELQVRVLTPGLQLPGHDCGVQV